MVKAEARVWRGPSAARLILASASATRAKLLQSAGVAFEIAPAHVDEAALKTAMKAERASSRDTALALAELKAQRISASQPEALVLGCDQLLDCAGTWFDKAIDRADAEAQLRALSGRVHELATAACVVKGGQRLWHAIEAPRLTMRRLDETLIAGYLERGADEAIGCVGAYRLEGLGAQLFTHVEGDYFSILGLPLLALLDFLRGQKIAP